MGKSKKVRQLILFKKLFRLQDGKCIICGKFMSGVRTTEPYKFTATIEHVVPLSQGGKNMDNILLSCCGCNNSRGHKPIPKINKVLMFLNKARQ